MAKAMEKRSSTASMQASLEARKKALMEQKEKMYATKGLTSIATREKTIEKNKSLGQLNKSGKSLERQEEKKGFDAFLSKSLRLDNTIRELEKKGIKQKEEVKQKKSMVVSQKCAYCLRSRLFMFTMPTCSHVFCAQCTEILVKTTKIKKGLKQFCHQRQVGIKCAKCN